MKRAGLENSSDITIWKYAKDNDLTLVTFNSDFCDIANLKGHPPKIVWLRTKNQTTSNIIRIFITKYELVKDFIENPDNEEWACLELK